MAPGRKLLAKNKRARDLGPELFRNPSSASRPAET